MDAMGLSGKTAIVTGAGREKGIGRAIAKTLLTQGMNLVMTDMKGLETAESIISQFPEHVGRVDFVAADVTKEQDVAEAIAYTIRKFGGLDVLVNNAGVGIGSSDFLELTERDWDLSFDVNFKGVVNFCKAAIPELRKSDSASIVNVASLSGLKAIAHIPACYTASKFAVVGMTKHLALQLASENIRCNAICPGSVRTDMMQVVMADIAQAEGISIEEAETHESATIAVGRAADPIEIGKVAAFLASSSSSYITGEALAVSGGMFSGL